MARPAEPTVTVTAGGGANNNAADSVLSVSSLTSGYAPKATNSALQVRKKNSPHEYMRAYILYAYSKHSPIHTHTYIHNMAS